METKAKPAKRTSYGLAEAKARLSEIVQNAQTLGPQQITTRGRPAAYVVSAEEWERRTGKRRTALDWYREAGVYRLGVEYDKASGAFRESPA